MGGGTARASLARRLQGPGGLGASVPALCCAQRSSFCARIIASLCSSSGISRILFEGCFGMAGINDAKGGSRKDICLITMSFRQNGLDILLCPIYARRY